MRIEIDQSGKVEDMSQKNKTKSVLISPRTKRKLQELFRMVGKSRLYVYEIFAMLLFCLTRDCRKSDLIVIDLEYPGKDKIILDMLNNIRLKYKLVELNIRFARIGNKPKAHYAAKNVFNNKIKADEILTIKESMEIIKKTDGRLRGCISILVDTRPRSSDSYYTKKKKL